MFGDNRRIYFVVLDKNNGFIIVWKLCVQDFLMITELLFYFMLKFSRHK